MKLLILTIIVLVIPTFFVFVFVMSTVSKLATLRNRCRAIRERIGATAAMSVTATNPLPGPILDLQARREFNFAVDEYNAARSKFPANLFATLWGLPGLELLPDQADDRSRAGLGTRAP